MSILDNDQFPDIFRVKFDSCVNENKYLLIANATQLPIKLYTCNYKDYNSMVCRRMMVTLSKTELENEINKGTVILSSSVKLQNNQNVMVMTSEFIRLPKYVRNAEEYLEYLIIADRLCIENSRICSKNNTNWLHGKLSKIKQMHIEYQKLFTSVESTYFNTPKFTNPTPTAAPYPVGNTKSNKPKPIKMNIVSINSKNNVNIYQQIISILNSFKLHNNINYGEIMQINTIINKIIIILFGDVQKYQYAFNKDLLKEFQLYHENKNILEIMLYYPIRQMYLKEQTYYKYGHNDSIKDLSSFILPIDIACLLPNNANISGPYGCSILPKSTSKWLSGPIHITGNRGVCDFKEFKVKFDLFTNNAFEKVQFTRCNDNGSLLYKMAITGSLISACAIKNPREGEFINFKTFLQYFYPEPVVSDIYKKQHESHNKYNYHSSTKLFEEIQEEDNLKNNNSDISDDSTEASESSHISNDLDDTSSNNSNTSNTTKTQNNTSNIADIDVAIECDFNDFDKSVELIYNDIKLIYPSALLVKKITENKHKYIIEGIPRYIDLFHCNSISHVVSKFHLDCVRAWYDGTMVYCFPTFICAANTNMCTDIRWVSNQKDVRDMVMKYYARGFGTYINNKDLISLRTYLTPANGYLSTGIKPNSRSWEIRKIMKIPVYGNVSYFGPYYRYKSTKLNQFPPLLKNDQIYPYL